MGKPVETLTVRVLLVQTVSHALIFAVQNVGGFAERAFLARDTVATASLGLAWTVFCLLYGFTDNVVNVCALVVGRRTGDGDASGARAAAGQAMLLAGAGGMMGMLLAVVCAIIAAFVIGPAHDVAVFLATQGLALGPVLATRAILGYFAGAMRIGPRLLAATSIVPLAVQLSLLWLLTGLWSWSVAGAGLARLGAALVAAAAVLVAARREFGGLRALIPRPNRVLLGMMVNEGSVLGLQQVVTNLIVLLLYLMANCSGDLTSAALTLTHSGVYPLLFCFAWGSSQAVSAAAAQAVGRGDPAELVRVTRLCLALSLVLAFALSWGAFFVGGGPALGWLIGSGPNGGALLAVSLKLMRLLAVFFVFDFAINFLSALLKAAKEQAYLLKAATTTATGFGILILALPPSPNGTCLMGVFITVQAAWTILLIRRLARCWPVKARDPASNCLTAVNTSFPC